MDAVNVEDMESFESIFIGLSTLQSATNNFDENNKLGEGGFGVVYKVCRHSFAKLSLQCGDGDIWLRCRFCCLFRVLCQMEKK